MAIPSVKQMVLNRLPYLTDITATTTLIEQFRIEATYFLQNQFKVSDADVETEATYKALQNMLFADMVTYWLVERKVIQTQAGDGTSEGSAAKTLKRAKADVTEVEFVTIKAADGALISMTTVDFMSALLRDICSKAKVLGIYHPFCTTTDDYNIIPAFRKGCDFPPRFPRKGLNSIFDGTPIG